MASKNSNKLTIDAYDKTADTYIQHTPQTYDYTRQGLKAWIQRTLSHVRPGGKVLEIGSATPRDARYIRSQGFKVQCSDVSTSFIEYLRSLGEPALKIDATKYIPGSYDLIFANAVFPHFTKEDTKHVLANIHNALNPNGIIAFNVKQGTGDEWVDEKLGNKRYINYWEPHEIYEVVRQANYEIIDLEDGCEGERPTHIWTRIIAQKLS